MIPAFVLTTAFALVGIGLAQTQVSDPATPAKISTVYTGDVINGKKVMSSLNKLTNMLNAFLAASTENLLKMAA